MSRNKKTGKSKHYAFIEFSSAEVAKIVAEAMDGYFFFGQKLQCRVMKKSEVHPELFKGANRAFRIIPWLKIERERHNKAVESTDPGVLEKQKKKSSNREKSRMKRIEAAGIEYDYESPLLQGTPSKGREIEPSMPLPSEKKRKKAISSSLEEADATETKKKRRKETLKTVPKKEMWLGEKQKTRKAAGGNNSMDEETPILTTKKLPKSSKKDAAMQDVTEVQKQGKSASKAETDKVPSFSPRRTRSQAKKLAKKEETPKVPKKSGKRDADMLENQPGKEENLPSRRSRRKQ